MSTTSEPSVSSPSTASAGFPANWTLADLQMHLGGVPASRIRLTPPPGTATEEDALRLDDKEDRLYELVNGVLVEKAMSFYESLVAMMLGHILHEYLEQQDLGVVSGADGQIRLLPTRMRIPDLAFIRWDRFPDGMLPKDRVCKYAPDIAVEILSEGNTKGEMEQKLNEYFEAGVQLVWYIDPKTRTATVYTSPTEATSITVDEQLEGKAVLPGFSLRLGELFERTDRRNRLDSGSKS